MSRSQSDARLRQLRSAPERGHHSLFGRTAQIATRLTSIPILDRDAVERWRTEIEQARPRWIVRGKPGTVEFYTLGVASYLDFCSSDDPQRDYIERAPRENRLLMRRFGPLYEAVRRALEEEIGEPVRYTRHFALPGFHIFLGQAIESASSAPVHFDMQYEYLPWREHLDSKPPFSFTLPVALPRAGAGLDTWNLTPEDVTRAHRRGLPTDLDTMKELKFRSQHPYEIGTLALHSGLMLHRIGRVSRIRDDDSRITLQGHGVRIDGVWELHW